MKFQMLQGLPGSGKSFLAETRVLAALPGQAVRVNRDLLRTMLHADRWKGSKTEDTVTSARDALIFSAMQRRVPFIISDDTNFHASCEQRFRQLAKEHGYDFEKEFIDTPIETCIKRDLQRARSVGERVIREMHDKYLAPASLPAPVYDTALLDAIICDLDGSLALIGDRSPYDAEKCEGDTLNEPVARIVRMEEARGTQVIFMSGRQEKDREPTERWLEKHGLLSGPLFMRATDDRRKDSIVKRELFEKHVQGEFNIVFVIDDRRQVVEMWRHELGLTVFACADGDF